MPWLSNSRHWVGYGNLYLQAMDVHGSIWSHITAMARARYLDNPNAEHLHMLREFKAEHTATYLCEDSLYAPYREGMGDTAEASTCLAFTLEGKRVSLESLNRQPLSVTTAVIQAAMLSSQRRGRYCGSRWMLLCT
jgi:hypothetical protein